MRKKKRGQITIFIILGIILLLAVAAIFYVQSRVREQQQEPQKQEVLTEVPEALKPVQNYVEQCLRDTARKAFKELGLHGGYIDMRDPVLTGYYTDPGMSPLPLTVQKASQMEVNDIDTKPYANDAFLLFSKNQNTEVAYWYHFDNYGTEQLTIPKNIEAQAERFIVRDINTCLDDFKELEEKRGMNITILNPEDIRAQVIVTQGSDVSDIDVRLTYPVTVQIGSSQTTLKDFRAKLDMDFARIMELATVITMDEAVNGFIEEVILQSLSGYQYVGQTGEKTLPPIAEVDNKPYFKMWVLPEVKEYAKDYILPEAFQRVSFSHTYLGEDINTRFSDTAQSIWTGVYGEMLVRLPLEADNNRYRNLRVELFFPKSDIKFDIQPRSGPILRPETKRQPGFLMFQGTTTNYYHFFYDISMPVYIMITELNNNTDEQYKFIFGLEGNIVRNSKMVDVVDGYGNLPPRDAFLDLSVSVDPEAWKEVGPGKGEDTCEESGIDIDCPPVPEQGPLPGTEEYVYEGSLITDEIQHLGNNITFTAIDGRNTMPVGLSDARVTYHCGMLETLLRNRASDPETGLFIAPVPFCIGDDVVVVEKPGYSSWLFDTVKATPENFNSNNKMTKNIGQALLYKEKEMEIAVDIIDAEQVKMDSGGSSGISLKPEQEIVLTITRYPYTQEGPQAIGKVLRGRTYTAAITYTPGEQVKMNLTPGYYMFEGMVTDDDPQVEPTRWCKKIAFVTKCYPPDGPITRQTLEQYGPLENFPVAGVTMANLEPILIEHGSLDAAQKMTIHTVGITRSFMLKTPEESYEAGFNSLNDAYYYTELNQNQATHYLQPSFS